MDAAALPLLEGFADLLLRSSFLVLLALAAAFFLRGASAASRHLVWLVCLLSLLFLPVFLRLMPPLEISVPAPVLGVLPPAFSSAGGTPAGAWLLAAYLLVALALLLQLLAGIARMAVLTRASRVPARGEASSLLEALRQREELGLPVRLLANPAITAPLSWGLFRPVVLLPPEGVDWDPERLRNVLSHELSHIRRLDWLCHLLAAAACAIYWFNPLVWLAARRLREEAERACDDAVLTAAPRPDRGRGRYAEDLLAIARGAGAGGRRRLVAEAMVRSFLGRRVVAILDPRLPRDRIEEEHLIRGVLAALSLVMLVASVRLVPQVDMQAFRQALDGLVRLEYGDAPDGREDRPVPQTPEDMVPLPAVPPEETVLVEGPLPARPLLQDQRESLRAIASLPVISLRSEPPRAAGTRPARLLSRRFPLYPPAARERGIEGFAVVQYDLDVRGKVAGAVVVEARPRGVFDRAALEAIRAYHYEAPLIDGEPVGLRGLRTRFVFRLKTEPG